MDSWIIAYVYEGSHSSSSPDPRAFCHREDGEKRESDSRDVGGMDGWMVYPKHDPHAMT